MNMKTLETDRLLLRDWRINDIGCEVFNESTIRFLISAGNNYSVVLKEDGAVIGTVGLNEDADGVPERRNVGVRLLEAYQNRGLMSEALECVIQNAGDIAGELSWLCRCDDKRSGHLAEKFGFQYVKTFCHVQKAPADEPKDFFYYVLKLPRKSKTGNGIL